MNSLNLGSYVHKLAVTAGAIIGAFVGVGFYLMTSNGSEAVAILQSGRLGGMESVQTKVSPQLVIDRRGSPQILIDKMQTRAFAQRVATAAGYPAAALGLAAVQYGGNGRIKTRAISDGTLVEIRVKAADPEQATKLAEAALVLGMVDDRATLDPMRAIMAMRIQDLEKDKVRLSNLIDVSTKAAAASDSGKDQLDQIDAMVTRLQTISDNLWSLRSAEVSPLSQESAIFAEPSLARPVISNWWVAAIAGLIGGGAVGLVFGMLVLQAQKNA